MYHQDVKLMITAPDLKSFAHHHCGVFVNYFRMMNAKVIIVYWCPKNVCVTCKLYIQTYKSDVIGHLLRCCSVDMTNNVMDHKLGTYLRLYDINVCTCTYFGNLLLLIQIYWVIESQAMSTTFVIFRNIHNHLVFMTDVYDEFILTCWIEFSENLH